MDLGLARRSIAPGLRLGLSLMLLMVACAAPSATAPAAPAGEPAATAAPSPAAAPALLPLRFAYTALSTTIAPYWIAETAGYFREEGLDLQTTFISASTVGMQSLLAREVDVTTVTGGAALQAAASGADIVLFATNVNALISQLITVPEITAPEQLRGQPLGIVRFGTVSDFVARLLLRSWGMEAGRDVPLIQTGGQAETIGALQNGAVRAVVVADLPALELRRAGGVGQAGGRRAAGPGGAAGRPGGDLVAQLRRVGGPPVRHGDDGRHPGQHQSGLPDVGARVRPPAIRHPDAGERHRIQDQRLPVDGRRGRPPGRDR